MMFKMLFILIYRLFQIKNKNKKVDQVLVKKNCQFALIPFIDKLSI